MATLMIFILVVTSLASVHADPGESGSALASDRAQARQEQGANFLLASGDTNANMNARTERHLGARREYDDDNIDLDKLLEASARYDIITSEGSNKDLDNGASLDEGQTRRQAPANSKNLARLLYGMPQFDRFYARYLPEKRASDLRRFVTDRDDKEFGGLNSLGVRMYREPVAKSTERLVQRLRDQIQATPHTFREKRRRCQFDPNLGIKNPSSCDTDSYFGAADYTMRNVWDSAGRR